MLIFNIIEEETEVLGEKPLRCPPRGKSINQKISWSTQITKDPSSLVYPIYSSPPSSCYQLTLPSLVFSNSSNYAIQPDCIHQINGFFQCFLTTPKTSLYTQNGCGKCLGYQPLKDLETERQELRKTIMDCVVDYCKVEFMQPSYWLYSVPNLLVIQHLVTLYLGGFDVRVVSEIE